MRLSTIAKIVAALVLVLVVALIAAAKSLNSDRYNAFLAERVKAATGLDLAFSGATKLKLGLAPRLSFTGITLSAGQGEPLLTIDRVEADIALLPLALRQLRLESLTLIRPVLRPHLLAALPQAGKAFSLADAPDGAPATRFGLSHILIEDATLLVGQPVQAVTLAKARIQPETEAGGPMALQIDGKWQDSRFTLGGVVGPFAALTGAKPYAVQLKGALGGSVATLRGTLAQPLAGKGLDLELHAQGEEFAELLRLRPGTTSRAYGPFKLAARLSDAGGQMALSELDAIIGKRETMLITAKGAVTNPAAVTGVDLAITVEAESLAALARLGGLDLPSAGPLKLSGKLTDIDNGWRLTGLKSTLGHSDLAGELSLVQTPRPRLYGRLAATTLNLAEFTLPQGKGGETGRSQPLRPAIPVADGRILPAESLPLDLVRGLDADLSLVAAKVLAGPVSLGETSVEFRQTGGRLGLDSFAAQVGDGLVKGELRLDTAAKTPLLTLRLAGTGLDLAQLTGGAIRSGKGDLALDLKTQGNSWRAWAGGTEGSVALTTGELVLAKGTGGELVTRLFHDLDAPALAEEQPRLRCLVARLPVKAGLISAEKGLAAETARAGALALGSVDLRAETIEMGIGAKGTAPLRLRGMLSAPVVTAEGKAPADATPCRTASQRRLGR